MVAKSDSSVLQYAFLYLAPGCFADLGCEAVPPPLSALLPCAVVHKVAVLQSLSYVCPVSCAEFKYELAKSIVFLAN